MWREPDPFRGQYFDVETDAAIVRASLGDAVRFGELFDRHHRVIWAYLARLAGIETADELAAEVFLVAFERRSTYDPERGQVRSWLYGIATNLLRTRQRSETRARRAFLRAAGARPLAIDQTEVVIEADDLADRFRQVRAAMADLGSGQRELLILHVWEGLSYDEIATALDLPIGTVRSRLSRARERLRRLLERGTAGGLDLASPNEGAG